MNNFFDAIGIDLGILVVMLMVLVLVLIVLVLNVSLGLHRQRRRYNMFMKGADGQSLERVFSQKLKEVDRLSRANEQSLEEVRGLKALLYLRIYFAGIIFVFIYNVGSSILRAMGDSRRPLYYLIVCCILNIVLDIVLVIVFHMGVAGVSIATIFSQGVSAVLITRALMHSDDLYQLEFRKIRFHKSALISLIWVGCPTGIQSVLYSVTNMLIQTFLNNLGTDTVAAWSAFGKIDSLYWMVNNAFGIAVTTFVGQNFGAGKYDRMKKSVRIGLCMGLCTALTLTLIFYNFGTPLFRLFTSDENVVSIGMQMLYHVAPAYCLFVFIELLSGALRGTGDVVIPMLITCFGVCLLRIAWLFFIVPLAPGLNTIVLSYPVTWAITAVMFIVYYCYQAKKWPKSSAKKTA